MGARLYVSALIAPAVESPAIATLSTLPAWALAATVRAGCRVRHLSEGERYRVASPALRRLGVDVDASPVPPAGLTVVEERTAYLRAMDPMTVAHEFGHLLDLALGGGVYRSGYDPALRSAFAAAREYVTPYAATGLDEYFAEGFRAWCGVNGERSPWSRVSRARLQRIDPALAACFAQIEFDETASG